MSNKSIQRHFSKGWFDLYIRGISELEAGYNAIPDDLAITLSYPKGKGKTQNAFPGPE